MTDNIHQRILAIAKRAGLKYPSEEALTPMEIKFAQLIVAECAEIADEQCVMALDQPIGVGQELLDQFGVAE
jgi:hypothetical protein